MIFAIDYDGTWSRDPDGFRLIVELLRARGHGCIMVTGRSDSGQYGTEVRARLKGSDSADYAIFKYGNVTGGHFSVLEGGK